MKVIVMLIVTLLIGDLLAQSQPLPLFYLNDEEIDLENVYVNPLSLDDIKVVNESKRGSIYMSTMQPITFLTLDMILKTKSKLSASHGQVIYIVDTKLIIDKSKVKIDASYFIDVEIKQMDKLTYLDEVHKSLTLVEINLLCEKPKPTIRLRGEKKLLFENSVRDK